MKVCPRCGYSDDPKETAKVSAAEMRVLVESKTAHPSEPPTLPQIVVDVDPFPGGQRLPTDPSGLIARARRTQAVAVVAAIAVVTAMLAILLLARC